MKPTVDLLTIGPEAVHNFRVGQVFVFVNGRWVTGWRLRVHFVHQWLHDLTRWWRPRTVVTAIDRVEGVITYGMERWSWRRWRWERVE